MSEIDRFRALCDGYIDTNLEMHPEWATHAGVHDYDDRLGSTTDEQYEASQRHVADTLAALRRIKRDALPSDAKLDCTLLERQLLGAQYEFGREDFRKTHPGAYVPTGSIFSLLSRDFAPLAERVRNAIARLGEFPRVIDEGKANLDRPPLLWTKLALQQCDGARRFLTAVPDMARAAVEAHPDLNCDLAQALDEADKAIEGYKGFLEADVAPRSDGEFAVGREAFDFYLANRHFLSHNADTLHEFGKRELAQVVVEMDELAARIEPGKSWREVVDRVKGEHPAADELKDAYRKEMERARDFVRDKALVTIPEGERLEMIDTPAFSRQMLPFAAYGSPPALGDAPLGLFYVTPIEDTMPDEEKEQRLRGHNRHWITIVALHEGYPGHHLQLVHSREIGSRLRRLSGTSLFVEGWALYCEQMMYEQGFYESEATRLVQLNMRLWRAARVIIDSRLSIGEMSHGDAVDFLVDNVFLERPQAEAEVNRFTQSPTQPMSYLVGMREIERLLDSVRAKEGSAFDLRSFHDRVLSQGSIAPGLVAKEVFGVDL
jgi:uncharacterized protein (DUF885 family)